MRPFKECHRRKQGQLSHPGEADEGRYFRASGHEYGRWPEEGHDAVTGTSRGARRVLLCALTPSTVDRLAMIRASSSASRAAVVG